MTENKIILRKMNKEEYDMFYRLSFEHHVNELMDEEHMTRSEAGKETESELREMLPLGLDSENNNLMTVRMKDSEEQIGFIWTVYEMFQGVKQSFICDFEIYEKYRRRGFASETLKAIEEMSKEDGCEESVLFVADVNEAAKNLYEKNGYKFLREMGYGKFLKKSIGGINEH